MNYYIQKKDKNKYYYKILLTTFIIHLIIVISYVYFKNIDNSKSISLIILAILSNWFLIFALPVFLLYFNHKSHSKSLIFNKKNDVFSYKNDDLSIDFTIDDIEKIELWLTPPSYDKRTDWLFFGKYHFTKIFLKDNVVINISCLVCDEIETLFNEDLISREKKIFPLIK